MGGVGAWGWVWVGGGFGLGCVWQGSKQSMELSASSGSQCCRGCIKVVWRRMATEVPAAAAALPCPSDAEEGLTWPAIYLAVHGTLFVGAGTAAVIPSTEELGIPTPKTSQAVSEDIKGNREAVGSEAADGADSQAPCHGESSITAASTSASACLCVHNLGWDGLTTPPETLFESLRSAVTKHVTAWPLDATALPKLLHWSETNQALFLRPQVAGMGLEHHMKPAAERLRRHADPKCVALLNMPRCPNASRVIRVRLTPNTHECVRSAMAVEIWVLATGPDTHAVCVRRVSGDTFSFHAFCACTLEPM